MSATLTACQTKRKAEGLGVGGPAILERCPVRSIMWATSKKMRLLR